MSEKRPGANDYTEELAKEICETIAHTSLGLKKLCARNLHWPLDNTIRRWLDKPDFCARYAQAKMKQADYMAEEIIAISDEGTNDYMEDEKGNLRLDAEHVQRSRLRVDSRKWLVAKLAPKVYGDAAITKHSIDDSSTVMQKIIDKL